MPGVSEEGQSDEELRSKHIGENMAAKEEATWQRY
jgi:hypothetical protein